MLDTDLINPDKSYDAVLVGAGIMSATLAALLHELDPSMHLLMLERLDEVGSESSAATNNAGTGHAANCELNYTPVQADGTINVSKALEINAAFEQTLEFLASLTEKGRLIPDKFLHLLPHISFVWGRSDVAFLKQRHQKLSSFYAFSSMEWSQDSLEIEEWIPLLMQGRDREQLVAATRIKRGTDVDFGALTSAYLEPLQEIGALDLRTTSEVVDLHRDGDASWVVEFKDQFGSHDVRTPFVFLGAGGNAITLLQKSGIPEGLAYGGFPVSGQWLVCTNSELTEKHNTKVYGKAKVGAPPMSVPHLDRRWIGGKRSLLFGPFAGFSTRFAKKGSRWDLFGSIKKTNLLPMLQVGIKNFDLINYLVEQLQLSNEDRLEMLQEFLPNASNKDWDLSIAGQRVQIIKRTDQGGRLQMGTEVVASKDGSLAALLGASPGASTAVSIMLEVLQRCFRERMASNDWQKRLRTLIPSFGKDLQVNQSLHAEIKKRNNALLNLM